MFMWRENNNKQRRTMLLDVMSVFRRLENQMKLDQIQREKDDALRQFDNERRDRAVAKEVLEHRIRMSKRRNNPLKGLPTITKENNG